MLYISYELGKGYPVKVKSIVAAALAVGMLFLVFPASAGASTSTERTAINRAYDVISVEYHGAATAVKVAGGIVEGIKIKTDGTCLSFLNLKTACAADRATLAHDEAFLSTAKGVESKAGQIMSLASSARATVVRDTTLSAAALVGWVHRLNALAAKERAYAKTVALDAARVVD